MDDEPYEDEEEYWEPDLGPMVVWLGQTPNSILHSSNLKLTRKKSIAKVNRHYLGKLSKVRVPSKRLRRGL